MDCFYYLKGGVAEDRLLHLLHEVTPQIPGI